MKSNKKETLSQQSFLCCDNHKMNSAKICLVNFKVTLREIAYMKTTKPIMTNSTSQGEEANFLNNRGYVFQPNNNLPRHHHLGVWNHENLSYGNQAIIRFVPHKLSVSNAPPCFQGQGASSSNYQGQRR